MKIALFDFCETLVDFQTGDAFIWFVQQCRRRNTLLLITYKVLRKLHIFWLLHRMLGTYVGKKLLLLSLRGYPEEELDKYAKEYYKTRIHPHLIKPVVSELQRLKREGYSIYIVSGGYEIYQRYFAEEFKISGVIANRIKFDGDICTGTMTREDCMQNTKVAYIKESIPDRYYNEWTAYSDSASDIPMLDFVGHPIVVSRDKRQLWADAKGYHQLIYKIK